MAEVSGGVYQASAYVVPRGGMLASGQARAGRGSVVGADGSSRRVGGGLPSTAGTGYDKDQASASFAQ